MNKLYLEEENISSDSDTLEEPEPVWKDAPRLCPQLDFPPYRYIPGLNPHPTRDEEGHSFEQKIKPPVPFHESNWLQCEPYVYGIDLYNQGYFWEARNTWETLQTTVNKDSLDANYLEALMLSSAAMLKLNQRDIEGVRIKSQSARWRMVRLRAAGHDGPVNRLFGLDIADLIEQNKRFFGPAWDKEKLTFVPLTGDPPRLEVEM
jgi:hypothetical protein